MTSAISRWRLAGPQVLSCTRFSEGLNRAIGGRCRLSAPAQENFASHALGEWRVIYVATFREAVYVLHSFRKKSRRTSAQDIEMARKRYKQMGG